MDDLDRWRAHSLPNDELVTKSRYIWNIRALQLLREQSAIQYAREVTPRVINGVQIVFPNVSVSSGIRVSVRSQRLYGRSLFHMLYEQRTQALALDLGMIALEALETANVIPGSFLSFGVAFRAVRMIKVISAVIRGTALLSASQKKTLYFLVWNYATERGEEKKTLVHGDLHAGNLIVNMGAGALGFVDLELLHIGRASTNFAQLWISFYFADAILGQSFYRRYVHQFAESLGANFNSDVRAEIAIRCFSMLGNARRAHNVELERKSLALLRNVLNNDGFGKVFPA